MASHVLVFAVSDTVNIRILFCFVFFLISDVDNLGRKQSKKVLTLMMTQRENHNTCEATDQPPITTTHALGAAAQKSTTTIEVMLAAHAKRFL